MGEARQEVAQSRSHASARPVPTANVPSSATQAFDLVMAFDARQLGSRSVLLPPHYYCVSIASVVSLLSAPRARRWPILGRGISSHARESRPGRLLTLRREPDDRFCTVSRSTRLL